MAESTYSKGTSTISSVSTTAPGAVVQIFTTERAVRFYPITESELKSIGSMDALANTLLAIGVGLISLALGGWINAVFSEKLTASGQIMVYAFAPILAVVGAIVLWLCHKTYKSRSTSWQHILDESK